MTWISVFILCSYICITKACTDFYMNFTDFKLSGRTLDLGLLSNWTITSHPVEATHGSKSHDYNDDDTNVIFWRAKIGTVGITANWFGDDTYGYPSLFADSLNAKGLSCSLLALTNTQYEERSKDKLNIFAGTFCLYVTQTYSTVNDLVNNLSEISVYGPDAIAQHYVIRDATGTSLILEFINRQKTIYVDRNDGISGFGITTNEPYFNYHLQNIQHYEWKRTLARQAISIPGNYYPEERFLRVHMVKHGMQDMGLMRSSNEHDDGMSTSFQTAFALTVQVLNTVMVPEGNQYGTDSGDSSGEGNADHTCWSIVRDHSEPALYWRDASNPTFRKIRINDVTQPGTKQRSMKMESGPFYIDMTADMK